jgi:hypothetical protein
MMKTFTIVAALLAGGISLAIAQGQPTGGYPPVAGGAGGNPITNPVPGSIEYKMPSGTGSIEYKMPSGKTVKLRTMKVRGHMMVLVPMDMACDVFHVNC